VKRRNRTFFALLMLVAALGATFLLTSISARSQGPLAELGTRLGSAFGSVEHSLRSRFAGPGRSDSLRWFAPIRKSVDSLRHPPAILLGAYDAGIPRTLDGVVTLENAVGRSFPLIQIYSAWGDKPEQTFPVKLATTIWDLGSVPVITWEPWLVDFSNALHPSIPLRDARDSHGMKAVAAGTYDFYITAWAREARRFGHPIFVRLGHEMNDPYRYPWGPQNNTNLEYIAAWRHVVERFRVEGADNVLWVWSPHVAYQYWETYYPGNDYVDWVATGALNYGPIAQWSQWWTFAEIFGQKYPLLASFRKPIMIAEFGSLGVGGNRAQWYRDALNSIPSRYPAVRALLFFNVKDDQTVTYQKVDWTITSDSATLQAVRAAILSWKR
jgi:hypothetical protein